uniref:Uncharacterized protein n=1 Tax=Vespula pensylvanica TaxID=30213 RepID=A0A834JIF4_VESPE|nr:hypothetical protein H0235_018381 [Vespula pensylvanica]
MTRILEPSHGWFRSIKRSKWYGYGEESEEDEDEDEDVEEEGKKEKEKKEEKRKVERYNHNDGRSGKTYGGLIEACALFLKKDPVGHQHFRGRAAKLQGPSRRPETLAWPPNYHYGGSPFGHGTSSGTKLHSRGLLVNPL